MYYRNENPTQFNNKRKRIGENLITHRKLQYRDRQEVA